MKYGSTSKRSRSKSSNRKNYQPRNKVYDSNGPDVRIRGTAHQIAEKYMNLAKDSSSAGDTVMAENYMQHAEHYQRIINGFAEQTTNNNNMSAPSDDNANTSSFTDAEVTYPQSQHKDDGESNPGNTKTSTKTSQKEEELAD